MNRLVSTMFMVQANHNALLAAILEIHPELLESYKKHSVLQYQALIDRNFLLGDDESKEFIEMVLASVAEPAKLKKARKSPTKSRKKE